MGWFFVTHLSDGIEVRSRVVVLAPGVDYRRLHIPELEQLVGRGVYYGAAVTEAEAMKDRDVFVVGGGNAAGQAAVHLCRLAKSVTMIVRGPSLSASTSVYLSRQIQVNDNIAVHTNTNIVGDGGTQALEYIELATTTATSTDTMLVASSFSSAPPRARTDCPRGSCEMSGVTSSRDPMSGWRENGLSNEHLFHTRRSRPATCRRRRCPTSDGRRPVDQRELAQVSGPLISFELAAYDVGAGARVHVGDDAA